MNQRPDDACHWSRLGTGVWCRMKVEAEREAQKDRRSKTLEKARKMDGPKQSVAELQVAL